MPSGSLARVKTALLGTDDDIQINAGLVTLGDSATNEVVVRFSDSLPDDEYKAEVFGFDDGGLGNRRSTQ